MRHCTCVALCAKTAHGRPPHTLTVGALGVPPPRASPVRLAPTSVRVLLKGATSGETDESCGVAAAPRCERQGSTERPGSVESVAGVR
jgi:hypothetical protein